MTIPVGLLEKIKSSTEEFFDLSGLKLDDKDVIQIAATLKKNTFIKRLNLSYNNIGDEGAAVLASVSTLEELDFHNGLSGYDDYANHIGDVGAKALANSQLKKLNLIGNSIGDKGIAFLSNNSTIVELIVDDCEITLEGIKEFFRTNATVKKLSLRANNIGDDGLSTISLNRTIEELDLSLCNISHVGAEYIANNSSLIRLQLSENDIQDSGATLLARHPKLKFLDLGGCNIGIEGALALSENQIFLRLNLYGNSLSSTVLVSLAGCYESHDDQVFIRTTEFIAQLPQKKSADTSSPGTNPGGVPLAASPLLFTPTHDVHTEAQIIPSSPPEELIEQIAISAAHLQLPPEIAAFFYTANPQSLQIFQAKFRKYSEPPPGKKQKLDP